MRRRALLMLAGALLAYAGTALPQATAGRGETKRIGLLVMGTRESRGHLDKALTEALRAQGYVEGRNLIIERRYADGGGTPQLRVFAKELEALKLDAVVTTCTPSTRAMKEQTASTPIVMAAVADPVGQGLIASLARPGNNLTGTSSQTEDILPKMVEYLAAIVPKGTTVAVLSDKRNAIHPRLWDRTADSLKRSDLAPVLSEINHSDQLEEAIERAARGGARALFVLPDHPLFLDRRARIVAAAAKNRLAGLYWASEFVDAGGLMSYGENIANSWKRASTYLPQIMRGTNPADLPVAQPTTFEFVVNRRAARELGIAIPQSLLVRADRVIE